MKHFLKNLFHRKSRSLGDQMRAERENRTQTARNVIPSGEEEYADNMRRRSHGLQNGNNAVINNQNTGSEATGGGY
ncbi:MAG: hypothetical protein KBA30_00315 [Clostridia bacterium]|nr:hypothetical protein [Clostridia bacterium]